MVCAPGAGRVVASSGEICANSSASEGPYKAPLMVTARYESAICCVWVMGVLRTRLNEGDLSWGLSLHQATGHCSALLQEKGDEAAGAADVLFVRFAEGVEEGGFFDGDAVGVGGDHTGEECEQAGPIAEGEAESD